MSSTIKNFEHWHKSRAGLLIFGILELAAAYIVGSRALDTASWWEYAFTLLLLIGGVQNIVRLIGTYLHGQRR